MTEDTPTTPPAARDAIEAATMAVYDHRMPDGDALGGLLHESHYIDDSPTIAEQLAAVRELCAGIARSAVAAYVAALPSEFGELKGWLAESIKSGNNVILGPPAQCRKALAAITALEARLADARAQERERIALGLEKESDFLPCKEDAAVSRAAAWLVRGNFSYDEADRLQASHEARLADAYERCARIAENACLVPPDGGSPTQGETDVAEAAARAIRALAAKE